MKVSKTAKAKQAKAKKTGVSITKPKAAQLEREWHKMFIG